MDTSEHAVQNYRTTSVFAAEFLIDHTYDRKCLLNQGQLKKGDFERFVKFTESTILGWERELCLNSLGGSLGEAIKISNHISGLFATYLPAQATCLSSCAIIFMSGSITDYGTKLTRRTMHPSAKLGFHSPSFSILKEKYTTLDIIKSYNTALK